MDDKLLSGLSPELQEKAKSCKSAEELMKLAGDNDVELSDEQLDAISGGGCFSACSHDVRPQSTQSR